MTVFGGSTTKDRVISDVKEVAETVQKFAEGEMADKLAAARAKAEAVLNATRERVHDAQIRAKEAVATTERSIQDHPWRAIGISAGIGAGLGLLIGLLIRRR